MLGGTRSPVNTKYTKKIIYKKQKLSLKGRVNLWITHASETGSNMHTTPLRVSEGRAMLVDHQSQAAGNGLVLGVDLGSDPRHSQLAQLFSPTDGPQSIIKWASRQWCSQMVGLLSLLL